MTQRDNDQKQSLLIDSYIHKRIHRKRPNSDLTFATSQSLFSSNVIDPGTNLLLRTIKSYATRNYGRCLDLGCGYGPLGLSLKSENTVESVELIDRDALAVEFARINSAENRVTGVEIHGSLGLNDVQGAGYDLIVSNLPGKAGDRVLGHLLRSSAQQLSGTGEFWGVIVSPLWPFVQQVLSDLNSHVLQVEEGSRHVAFGFRNPPKLELNGSGSQNLASVYGRDVVKFEVQGKSCQVATSHGLPEFDSLSHATQLLLEQLYKFRKRGFSRVAAFNLTQGYVPVALLAAKMSDEVQISDRDLLALRTTEQNIVGNQLSNSRIQSYHAVSWLPVNQGPFELVVGTLRGDEPREALAIQIEQIVANLGTPGVAIVSGGSTPITRVQKQVAQINGVQIEAREKYRGSSVILFRKSR